MLNFSDECATDDAQSRSRHQTQPLKHAIANCDFTYDHERMEGGGNFRDCKVLYNYISKKTIVWTAINVIKNHQPKRRRIQAYTGKDYISK